MAEHESSIGASDEWYTPPELFTALGLRFDLDPCSPGADHWVPAQHVYTVNGLEQKWFGRVFMNPPFGGRNAHVPWLKKFLHHNNGVGLVRAYTSSRWFQTYMSFADLILYPRGKTKFVRPDGSVGSAPGHGVVIIGMGTVCVAALKQSKLGLWGILNAE